MLNFIRLFSFSVEKTLGSSWERPKIYMWVFFVCVLAINSDLKCARQSSELKMTIFLVKNGFKNSSEANSVMIKCQILMQFFV